MFHRRIDFQCSKLLLVLSTFASASGTGQVAFADRNKSIPECKKASKLAAQGKLAEAQAWNAKCRAKEKQRAPKPPAKPTAPPAAPGASAPDPSAGSAARKPANRRTTSPSSGAGPSQSTRMNVNDLLASDAMASEPQAQPAAPSAEARALQAQVKGWLEQDRKKAESAPRKVDLSVLGIALTRPVSLPACPPGSGELLTKVARTCSADVYEQVGLMDLLGAQGGMTALLAQQQARALGGAASALKVRIASSARPEWFGLAGMILYVVDDSVARAKVGPVSASQSEAVERALDEKYRGYAGRTVSTVRCQNEFGAETRFTVTEWAMPGLKVTYDPLGTKEHGRCDAVKGDGNGYIDFETEAFQKLMGRIDARKPKL